MAIKFLAMRTIVQQSCWPYSGRRYQVWEKGRCILETDDLKEAEDKAGEV